MALLPMCEDYDWERVNPKNFTFLFNLMAYLSGVTSISWTGSKHWSLIEIKALLSFQAPLLSKIQFKMFLLLF